MNKKLFTNILFRSKDFVRYLKFYKHLHEPFAYSRKISNVFISIVCIIKKYTVLLYTPEIAEPHQVCQKLGRRYVAIITVSVLFCYIK